MKYVKWYKTNELFIRFSDKSFEIAVSLFGRYFAIEGSVIYGNTFR